MHFSLFFNAVEYNVIKSLYKLPNVFFKSYLKYMTPRVIKLLISLIPG